MVRENQGLWQRLKGWVGLSETFPIVSSTQDPGSPQKLLIHDQGTGSSGTAIFHGYFSEDYLSSLRNRPAADAYDKMRRSDAKVKMCLSAVMNPIKAATWAIEPGEGADSDEIAQHHADFIEHVLFCDMEKPWSEFIHEALSFCIYGHSVFEIINKVVLDHPRFGSYNGIKSLSFRSQRTLERWNLDPQTAQLVSVTQFAFGDAQKVVDIPAQYLLIFSIDKEGDNYPGISYLRSCFGPWSRKQTYLKLMAIGTEKSAIPTPVAKVPEGKENSVQFSKMIEVLEAYTSHQSNYITTPEGWDITFVQNPFNADNIKSAIEFEDKQIVYSFLANFLELGMTGGGGSYALSFDLSDFFLSNIEHLASLICEQINSKVIPDLIKLNFGEQAVYPKLKHSGISDKIGKEFAEMMKALVDSKMIVPDDRLEEDLRRRIGLPEISDQGQRQVSQPSQGSQGYQGSQPSQGSQGYQASERLKLAEKNAKLQIKEASSLLLPLMQSNLRQISQGLIKRILGKQDALSSSSQVKAIQDVVTPGVAQYRVALTDAFAQLANQAIDQARREVPKKKGVKLYEGKRGVKLSEIDKLPSALKAKVQTQAALVVDTQVADLEKNIKFQYTHSLDSTDSPSLLEKDLTTAGDDFIEGPSLVSGSTTLAAGLVNDGRDAFFSDPAVADGIESFTFVNGDPVSPICQDLAGTVFAKDDPEADRYYPPLHYNCKSYIVPNLVGNNNPALTDGGLQPSDPSLNKYVTLSERNHSCLEHH